MKNLEKIVIPRVTGTNLLKGLVGFAVGYFTYKTLVIYLRRRKYRHIPGPSPKKLFFLFNIP